ncbi:hypothetical protein DRN69_08820 [Candidatus Pacearchaeota archaeon]|nr:MAG: hypothetical protein DRN69_08820 [Candidatus Pacearchaeota archaeon]
MNKKGISVGIVLLIMFIGYICYIGITALIDHYKYDKDCLNKIANEVCKESGYSYGEAGWNMRQLIYCYVSNRSLNPDKMEFTKQDLNQCRKK